MGSLTTLLLLIGLVIIWISQRREKESKKSVKKGTIVSLFPEEEVHFLNKENKEINEDLAKHHLHGVLNESIDENKKRVTARDKINRKSELRRALLWSEILDKPLSERYNDH